MSKQRKRRKTPNSASPSTPTHATKYRDDDNMFATPKSHCIHDDDSDSSPYNLSFSQRAIGVEVTWGEKTRSIPFKSKKRYVQRNTESPPMINYVDIEPVATESPKGVFKFMLGCNRLQVASQIEEDFQRIADEATSVPHSNNTTTTNETTSFYTATEHVAPDKSRSNSPNFKQLLNDSEDMDLMLCSQRIEQEVCSRTAEQPVVQTAIASKGFSDLFSDDDDDLLLANLDDPLQLDKKLPHKSSFARHKSIAIQPNSSTTNGSTSSTHNTGNNTKKSETNAVVMRQPVKQNDPSTPSRTTTAPILVRHKSMPSPNVTISNAMKRCSAEEIEIKRLNARAKLELRRQRLTKNQHQANMKN